MSEKKIYHDFPYDLKNKEVLLGSNGRMNLAKHYPTYKERMQSAKGDSNIDFENPEKFNNVILDQTGNSESEVPSYNKYENRTEYDFGEYDDHPNVDRLTVGDYDEYDNYWNNKQSMHMGVYNPGRFRRKFNESVKIENVEKGTVNTYDDAPNYSIKTTDEFVFDKSVNKEPKTKIQSVSLNEGGTPITHFRKARKPLNEHPLNTTLKHTSINEDMSELVSKGLTLGGSLIVRNGVSDLLSGTAWKPIFKGATLVGAGVLIYKLTDQDIKKFYRNYVSRLQGNYENIIPYPEYRQFVKKYNFKYEQDYYYLNDILAGREDPIDMNKFMELNNTSNVPRYQLARKPQDRIMY